MTGQVITEVNMISIIMGSKSDWDVMINAGNTLKDFGIDYELKVLSAHRTPDQLREYLEKSQEKGIKVFIAGAGGAAHLAGVIASYVVQPVLGVPLSAWSLGGLDSLLSTVQMPSGTPVATFAIGKAGAINAALFAVQILSFERQELKQKIKEYRERKVQQITSQDQ